MMQPTTQPAADNPSRHVNEPDPSGKLDPNSNLCASGEPSAAVPEETSAEASAHSALQAAQEGIESVAQMSGALDQSEKLGVDDLPEAFRSIHDPLHGILQSATRDAAVEALVKRVALELAGHTVRGVQGRDSITKMYDSKLGWLAPTNEVRQEMTERFLATGSDTDKLDTDELSTDIVKRSSRLRRVDSWWALDLSTDVTPRRLVLFIKPRTEPTGATAGLESNDRPSWLVQGADVWAVAVASRPLIAMPRIAVIGRRPMITVLGMVALLGLLALWPVRYPVPCQATVEAQHPRLVSSPFDATLRKSLVKPGDEVVAGQVLLELDGRPLRMELGAIEAEIKAMEKERTASLASGEIAASQKADLQGKKLSHRRDLLVGRLGKLSIVSPVNGIVIGGDLERYVDSPLTTGQSLMEIASLDRVIVEVEIPEFEISMLSENATTRIRFASVGGRSIYGDLELIYPAAEVREDQNVFVGRLTVPNPEGKYRPGMKGDVTAFGPLRPFAWSYLRRVWEQALWSVGY